MGHSRSYGIFRCVSRVARPLPLQDLLAPAKAHFCISSARWKNPLTVRSRLTTPILLRSLSLNWRDIETLSSGSYFKTIICYHNIPCLKMSSYRHSSPITDLTRPNGHTNSSNGLSFRIGQRIGPLSFRAENDNGSQSLAHS